MEETAKKYYVVINTSCAAMGIFLLGKALHDSTTQAKTLWFLGRNISELHKNGTLLPKLATALPSVSHTIGLFQLGLFAKYICTHFSKNISEGYAEFQKNAAEVRLDKALMLFDRMQFPALSTVLLYYCSFQDLIMGFRNYLNNNNEDIAGAARLFPSLFQPPLLHRLIGYYELPSNDGLRIEAQPVAHKIADYLKSTYEAPISDQETDELIKSDPSSNIPAKLNALHGILSRIKELNTRIAHLPVLELDELDAEDPLWTSLLETIEATKAMGARVKALEPRLIHFREQLLQLHDSGTPTVQVLNEIGLSTRDYKILQHAKKRVLDELADRGIYGRHDLIREGLIRDGKNDPDETVSRLELFLRKKPLPPLPEKIDAFAHLQKKTQRIASAIFDVILKLLPICPGFYYLPYLTTAGALLGLVQSSARFQEYSYYAHKILGLLVPDTTTSALGKLSAFTAGANIGSTIRDYVV